MTQQTTDQSGAHAPEKFSVLNCHIVTARADGTVPLNSQWVCQMKEANNDLLPILIDRANAHEELTDALRILWAAISAIKIAHKDDRILPGACQRAMDQARDALKNNPQAIAAAQGAK